jgi:hypothetical protein
VTTKEVFLERSREDWKYWTTPDAGHPWFDVDFKEIKIPTGKPGILHFISLDGIKTYKELWDSLKKIESKSWATTQILGSVVRCLMAVASSTDLLEFLS